MSYPDKLCVISPHIFTIPTQLGPRHRKENAVYLHAFSALLAARYPDGRFAFEQIYRHDPRGDASVELLIELCNLLDEPNMAFGAFRIGDLATSLVQVPNGSTDEVRGKVALLQLRDAVMRQPIDAALLDAGGGLRTLQREALSHDLLAEWDEPGASYNPARLRLQLCDRTQAMWLAIARARLSPTEMRQAEQDFLLWKEDQLID